jgi:hypothetical protein
MKYTKRGHTGLDVSRSSAFLAPMSIHFGTALVFCAIGSAAAGAQATPPALRNLTMLTAKEISAIERGDAVAMTIDAPEKTEIATLGVVRLEAPRTFYVEHVGQLTGFLAGAKSQSGTFSEPARLEDVAALSLDGSDAKALQKCQPLKCDVKLPAREMERFRAVLDKTHDPLPTADSLMREWLVAYVNAYRADSAEETVVYDDTKRPVRSSDAFRALLAEPMPAGIESEPFTSMLTPRNARPSTVTSRIAWEMDRMPGLKPTLEVVERSILTSAVHSDHSWMARKLLYASHYFESAIEYITVADAIPASGETAASYLIVLRRQKFDDLPSGGLFNIRGKAVKKLREAMRTTLASTRTEMALAYAASRANSPATAPSAP